MISLVAACVARHSLKVSVKMNRTNTRIAGLFHSLIIGWDLPIKRVEHSKCRKWFRMNNFKLYKKYL